MLQQTPWSLSDYTCFGSINLKHLVDQHRSLTLCHGTSLSFVGFDLLKLVCHDSSMQELLPLAMAGSPTPQNSIGMKGAAKQTQELTSAHNESCLNGLRASDAFGRASSATRDSCLCDTTWLTTLLVPDGRIALANGTALLASSDSDYGGYSGRLFISKI